MQGFNKSFLFSLCLALGAAGYVSAQVPSALVSGSKQLVSVPSLITINGLLRDRNEKPLTGVVGVRFALYKDQQGGAPLWTEDQNVRLDLEGRYLAVLGLTQPSGLPAELFAVGEPRWLGVHSQLAGEEEQPRMFLVSVPYALKAADADTVGGRPASDFVLSHPVKPSEPETDPRQIVKVNPEGPVVFAAFTGGRLVKTEADISGNGVHPTDSSIVDFGSVTANASIWIDASNHIGIGTASPTAPLHVYQRQNSGISAVKIDNDGGGTGTGQGVQFAYGSQVLGGIAHLYNGAQWYLRFSAAKQTGAGVAESPQMSILGDSGNVGIGTILPLAKLDIAAGTAQYALNISGSNNPEISFQNGADNVAEIGAVSAPGAYIQNSSANDLIVRSNDHNILFSTAGNGLRNDLTINAGSVGIGTAAPATTLQVVGDVRVGTSGTNGCLQGFGGAAIAGTCSSDARLKQNIQPFDPVLDKVTKLQPVSYEWNAAEHPEYHFGNERTQGLIAQEVEKIFPNMVATDERGYKAVNYSQLPLLLLQAVRELTAERDQQQATIQRLLSDVEQLKAHLTAKVGSN